MNIFISFLKRLLGVKLSISDMTEQELRWLKSDYLDGALRIDEEIKRRRQHGKTDK